MANKAGKGEVEQQRRTEQLHQLAIECAWILAYKYDLKRVYLFGSLTGDRLTHHGSDVDLAVEGLISASYFTALSDLYDLTHSGIEIDLVPMEDAYPELRERIIKEGKLLCERK